MNTVFDVESDSDADTRGPVFQQALSPSALWLIAAFVTLVMVAFVIYGYIAPGV